MQVDGTQRKSVALPALIARNSVPLPNLVVNIDIPHSTAYPEDWELCERVIWEPASRALEQRRSRTTSPSAPRPIWIALVPVVEETPGQALAHDLIINAVGCLARVVQVKRKERQTQELGLPESAEVTNAAENTRPASFTITLETVRRLRVHDLISAQPYFKVKCELLIQPSFEQLAAVEPEMNHLGNQLNDRLNELLAVLHQLEGGPPSDVKNAVDVFMKRIDKENLPDVLCNFLDGTLAERLGILRAVDLKERIQLIERLLENRLAGDKEELKRKLRTRLAPIDRLKRIMPPFMTTRNRFLENSSAAESTDEIFDRVRQTSLPETVRRIADREMKRLERMSPAQAEYSVIRTYLEWIVDLPWGISSDETIDLTKTRKQLDKDHYGLDKVKTRILQYMAVRKLRKDMKGPIICLVGPPGVGKTSLGKSVAKATGRKFHRVALGGARDVAEIKGHRRTYVGALPGLIVQGLKAIGTDNPVFMLDEIDKLGSDPLRGDPSSALLEVLDPEQNNAFQDHYLGIPFDLSRVLFIATANSLETIPLPLRDRMEIIRLGGYTLDEKLFIAKNYLVPKQLQEHGLTSKDLEFTDDVLALVANDYTAEAGVRSLERQIASLCRAVVMKVLESREQNNGTLSPRSLSLIDVENILGPPKFTRDVAERTTKPGVVTGLSYSSIGAGAILFVEVACYPGDGQLKLTGNLGDVIRESSQIALSWVRSHSHQIQFSPSICGKHRGSLSFTDIDVHVHFPAGSIAKDGPSAGIAICTALISLLTGVPCKPLHAMTGELTLRGHVLPIGGVKEKVLAAHRAGINRIILPDQNHKDVVAEVPDSVKRDIEFVYCKQIDEVLRHALGPQIFSIDFETSSKL